MDGLTSDEKLLVIVVLGCTVNPDGTMSDWLAARVDAAASLYHSLSKSNEKSVSTDILLIVSGGAVRSPYSEASVMRRYLTCDPNSPSRNTSWLPIAVEKIIEEEDAQNTPDNCYFAMKLLHQMLIRDDGEKKKKKRVTVFLVTSDFHMERGQMLLENEIDFWSGMIRRPSLLVDEAPAKSRLVDEVVLVPSSAPGLDRLVQRQQREKLLMVSDRNLQLQRHAQPSSFHFQCIKFLK